MPKHYHRPQFSKGVLDRERNDTVPIVRSRKIPISLSHATAWLHPLNELDTTATISGEFVGLNGTTTSSMTPRSRSQTEGTAEKQITTPKELDGDRMKELLMVLL